MGVCIENEWFLLKGGAALDAKTYKRKISKDALKREKLWLPSLTKEKI